MTDKQIIIDGVDVSGCEYYFKYREGYCCWHTPCEGNTCPYKLKWALQQLKDKEQECEELKEKVKKYGEINEQETKDYAELKTENEELKKANKHIEHNRNQKANKLMRIEKLITACSTGYTDEFIQELLVILHDPEPNSFENKYKTTLTEIKEIALGIMDDDLKESSAYYDAKQILQKISECEGNDDLEN